MSLMKEEAYLLIALAFVTWVFDISYKGLDFIAILAVYIIADYTWNAVKKYIEKMKEVKR